MDIFGVRYFWYVLYKLANDKAMATGPWPLLAAAVTVAATVTTV